MLLTQVLLMKPLAIKTCLLLQWDDDVLGSELNSCCEAQALEIQLSLAVMESGSLADPFKRVQAQSVWGIGVFLHAAGDTGVWLLSLPRGRDLG